ncbi:prepilin-type N-terminal cleavage/methylation domain-containing protein [Candidatus Auribacterota bacterium]
MIKKEKGFTLIEILFVIAIIAVLAGLLIPTVGLVQNKARKGKAESMIQSLSVAVKMYQNDFGLLPTSADFSGSNATTVLVQALGQRFIGSSAGNVGPYVEFKNKDLNGNQIIDPWGNPYYYYGDDDNGATGDAPYNNVYSFDIYSMGKDGSTGSGSSAGDGSDDINNWS